MGYLIYTNSFHIEASARSPSSCKILVAAAESAPEVRSGQSAPSLQQLVASGDPLSGAGR